MQTVHAHRVYLHNEVWTIDIDNESGHSVSFAVHKAVHIGLWVGQEDILAEVDGVLQFFAPEVAVDVALFKAEEPHGDGVGLVVAGGEILVAGIEHLHDVAVVQVFVFACNSP